MTAWELFHFIKNYFGDAITELFLDFNPEYPDDKEPTFVLYDSFTFWCKINSKTKQFESCLFLDTGCPEYKITTFFGRPLSTDSDIESIKSNLAMVDEYCRLRLPDKFLKKYEETCHDELHF